MLQNKAWVSPRMGSLEQAIDYCHKDGNYVELGQKPTTNQEKGQMGAATQKLKWKTILDLAKAGNMAKIENDFPREFILHKPRLLSEHAPESVPICGVLPHEWWIGPTGSGKSRLAWELYPTHFSKQLNKWWDGYQFEDIVIIEEWSPKNECTASYLKQWADRYPFNCEIKGGSLPKIRPKKIIVLSNYTIDQCFPRTEDAEPMKRRFKVIEFPTGKLHAQARIQNYIPSTPVAETDEELNFEFNFNTDDLDKLLESEDEENTDSLFTAWDLDQL